MEKKIDKFKNTAVVIIKDYTPQTIYGLLRRSRGYFSQYPLEEEYCLFINGRDTGIIVTESLGSIYFRETREEITEEDIKKLI